MPVTTVRFTALIVAMGVLGLQSTARAESDDFSFELPPLVLAGVGLAAVAAGGVFGLLASSNYDDARNDPTHRGATESFDSAETFVDVGNLLLITGAAVAAIGFVWWFATFEKDRSEGIALGIGPQSLQLQGEF